MLIKLLDILGRTVLLFMTLLLSKKVKLRITCWVMHWLAKKVMGKPICVQYTTDVGTLSMTVTGAGATLTWDMPVLGGKKTSEEKTDNRAQDTSFRLPREDQK